MSREFTMCYKGYDLIMNPPEHLTIQECEAELRKTIEANPEMEFKGKNWETPKEMLS
jgi:hypothetical protein